MALAPRYEQLWAELTSDEVVGRDESYRIDQRIKRLNDLGFDVSELAISSEDGGSELRLRHAGGRSGPPPAPPVRADGPARPGEPGPQPARRPGSVPGQMVRGTSAAKSPEDLAARRWLDEKFYGTLALVPAEMRGKLPDAELFHEISEHRWLLSEARGADVGRARPCGPYVDYVLRFLPEAKVDVLTGPPTEEFLPSSTDDARFDHDRLHRPVDGRRPEDVRRLPGLTIVKLAVGPCRTTSTCCAAPQTGEGLLIDAANEATGLRDLVTFEGPPVSAILTTHRHSDHWQALAEIADEPAPRICRRRRRRRVAGRRRRAPPPRRHDHRRRPVPGDHRAARAHAGLCRRVYRDPSGIPHLFTGDCLFPGGVGKTTAPEDFPSLIDDVSSGYSTSCPTTPGSTRVTETTRRSASSARTSANGAPAAGDQAGLVPNASAPRSGDDLGLPPRGRQQVQDRQLISMENSDVRRDMCHRRGS